MAVTPCWKRPCCTFALRRCQLHLVDGSFGPSLSEDFAPSLPRRCAYPCVCGYVSLMSTQKTATDCELTPDLRDDSGYRALWHETSDIRAMAQLSLQYPGCLVDSISSHCLRLVGTRSPGGDLLAFLRGVVLVGWRPGSPRGDSVVSNRVFYLAPRERDCYDSPGVSEIPGGSVLHSIDCTARADRWR